jgi:methylmalonyl-CoA mutase cobalamin-binding subunit
VLYDRVVAPLVQAVGERWSTGDLRPKNEHLATSVLRTFLGQQLGTARVGPDGARIVITTPAGQRHELGALLAAVLAEECGWVAVYLGPDLPAEEIAAAALDVGARAVGLSLVYPRGDAGTVGELRRLRTHVGTDTTLVAGGQGADSYAPVLDEIGALRTGDLGRFRAILADLLA